MMTLTQWAVVKLSVYQRKDVVVVFKTVIIADNFGP